jgi:ABC-type transport system involved in multi-copper enzyme maturation permease subunit
VRAQIRSEILKLRTVWSTWLIVAIAMALVLLLCILVAFVQPRASGIEAALIPVRGSARWFDNIFSTMGVAQNLTLVLGVLIVTGEYRHKTVTPTYLAEPRRGRVTAAKLVVSAGAGLLLAVVVGAVALAFGSILVAVGDGTASVMLGQYRLVIPGVLGAAVLFAIYGVGLGAMVKNQVVAIVVGIGFSAIVEPIVDAVAPQVGKYLPGYAAQALAGSAARGIGRVIPLLTWWEGGLALLGYGVFLAAVGTLTTLRADVT